MSTQETQPGFSPERQSEHREDSNREDYERLAKEREQSAERSRESQQEQLREARHELDSLKIEQEKKNNEDVSEKASAEKQPKKYTSRKKAFDTIMKQTQDELPAPSRTFSKVIHNPVVEKVSDILGSTVARPDAILSGAAFAFILSLIIYTIAHTNGYPLTGTETIAAFIAGWIIGNVYDYIKKMVRGN